MYLKEIERTRSDSSTLKMKAASSSEEYVMPMCNTTRSDIPEDRKFNIHFRGIFKSDFAHVCLLPLYAAITPTRILSPAQETSTRTGFWAYIRNGNWREQVKIIGNLSISQLFLAKLSCTAKFICIWVTSAAGNYIHVNSSKIPSLYEIGGSHAIT